MNVRKAKTERWYPSALPAAAVPVREPDKTTRQPSRPRLALRPRKEHTLAELLRLASGLHWYGLRVPPQREFAAQVILERYGLATFMPVRHEWPRRSRYNREKELRTYAVAPCYIFAGFPPGVPLWFDLFNLPLVNAVVGIDGRPLRLPSGDMATLLRETAGGVNAPNAHRFMQTHHEFAAGDMVDVVDGPFRGMTVPVKDIRGSHASLVLELFGGSVETVDVPLEFLEAAE